jgi:SAM-dependent methyltransferase
MAETSTERNGGAPMEFTGERFTPECAREIWYEHWHRYQFASALAAGRRVLDAACGEGYGSALLAGSAASVLGVDIDPQAVEHARQRYSGVANLHFEPGDCTALDLPAASRDLVVSFETLEHVAAQEDLVAGFARILDADGVLVISSPDKRTYSDATGFHNEFHVRELYRDELLALLQAHFPHVRLYGQKLLFQSAIWAERERGNGSARCATADVDAIESGLAYDPLYFIAVCSKRPLETALPALALFGDREESVYRHYNGEVRRNMAAGARIAELEAALAAALHERDAARAASAESAPQRSAPRPWWRRWLGPAR